MRLTYPDPELSDGAVALRAWQLGDADVQCVRQAAADPRIPQHTSLPAHYTPAAARAFIRRQWAWNINGEAVSLVIVEEPARAPVGSMFMSTEARVLTIGYWLVPGARGRGIGTRAVRLSADWALTQTYVDRVDAIVRPDNTPSIRALQTAGFTVRPAPDHFPNLRFSR
jgi:ribosomal-protein-alanine N-acetyltransferase